ncbi:MAG: hypothetical protein INR70_35255 [Parafilimonas terrae]|jgi:hypothetical protein|nr:hypothetical protein [Parafilimonas terrae]
MVSPDPREPRLPESVTRHLQRPKHAIWPTPDDRHRPRTGRHRPRIPTRVFTGVWLWVAVYNIVGAAILAALWASMGR